MTWWQNWLVLLATTVLVFVFWGWVPIERLDRYWRWNNPVGRPLLNTLVITGVPAVLARLTRLPAPWLLIPVTFLLTQYAVLSGRVLPREMLIAGWVMILTTLAIWLAFWLG